MASTITYINFAYCELDDKWQQISDVDSDVYQAIDDNATINIRWFSEGKTPYYLKKDAKITIKDHILKFDKSEFHK